jgi:hypothetical protein
LRASFPPGEARENWAILRALSAEMGAVQPWNTIAQLRRALVEAVPHLEDIDEVPENAWQALPPGSLGKADFVPAVTDHYLVNPIARASTLMAELRGGEGAVGGAAGGGVGGFGRRAAAMSSAGAAIGCLRPASRIAAPEPAPDTPRHEGVETIPIDDDIVSIIVWMSGPATGMPIAYSRCAAAGTRRSWGSALRDMCAQTCR